MLTDDVLDICYLVEEKVVRVMREDNVVAIG
jgi:hypothetical protein